MTAILTRDLLAYCGGDSWRRFGTFSRRTTRIARAGESVKEVFTRADASTCATYLGADGLYHLAAAGVMRPHWVDTNGDGVGDLLTYLSEPGNTNRLLQSQALATTWAATALTPTNNTPDTLAPDGTQTATKLVPSAANSLHYVSQAVAITANEFLADSGWVKAGAYTGFVLVLSDAGVGNGLKVGVDLTTGAIVLAATAFGTGTLSGSKILKGMNGWYRILLWGAIGNGVVSASTFWEVFDTAAHAGTQTAYAGDGVSGIYAWGAQLERNGVAATGNSPPTSYIATAGAIVSRQPDVTYLPTAFSPQALTVYLKHIELGISSRGGGGCLAFTIGDNAGGLPKVILTNNGGYSGRYQDGVNPNQISNVGGAQNYGDVLEHVITLTSGGVVQLTQAVNGGAPSQGAASAGGITLAGAFAANSLYVGPVGPLAIARLLIVAGVHTLAECQAVP